MIVLQAKIFSHCIFFCRKWKGDKREIRKICVVNSTDSSKEMLMSGRCRIKLWDLSTGKTVLKFPGHNSPLLDMRPIHDGSLCASCASGDRYVSVWSLDVAKSRTHPVYVLVCDNFIRQINIRLGYVRIEENSTSRKLKKRKKIEQTHCQVSGVASNGSQIVLWSFPLSSTSAPIQSQEIISPKEGNDPFLHAEFCSNHDRYLLVARGLRIKPLVDLVKVCTKIGGFRSVELDPLPSRLGSHTSNMKEGKDEVVQAEVLSGSASVSLLAKDPSLQSAVILAKNENAEGKRKQLEENSKGDVSVIDTRSFIEKLNSMEHHASRSSKHKLKERVPKAESLQSAIQQAIHSDDPALFESCLDITASTTIRRTCQRLSVPYVIPLLLGLLKRFETNANRAGVLIPWIREVLLFHGSYLMTLPDIGFSLLLSYSFSEIFLLLFGI